VDRDADFFFILARLRSMAKAMALRVLDRIVDDRMGFVAECVAGLVSFSFTQAIYRRRLPRVLCRAACPALYAARPAVLKLRASSCKPWRQSHLAAENFEDVNAPANGSAIVRKQ